MKPTPLVVLKVLAVAWLYPAPATATRPLQPLKIVDHKSIWEASGDNEASISLGVPHVLKGYDPYAFLAGAAPVMRIGCTGKSPNSILRLWVGFSGPGTAINTTVGAERIFVEGTDYRLGLEGKLLLLNDKNVLLDDIKVFPKEGRMESDAIRADQLEGLKNAKIIRLETLRLTLEVRATKLAKTLSAFRDKGCFPVLEVPVRPHR
ncbi:MAG: hypothetical protein ABL918_02890 [Chakrabartia sp.]